MFSHALMAIEPLLEVVLDCSDCQSLSCQVRECHVGPGSATRHCGDEWRTSWTQLDWELYPRRTRVICAGFPPSIRWRAVEKSFTPMTTGRCNSTTIRCSWLRLTPITAKSCGKPLTFPWV